MRCPKCQFDNREGVKFCEKCGARMELVCPNCGAKIPLDRQFCGECGHNLSLPSEPSSPQEPSLDEKLAKIQRYLPKGLTEKILAQRGKIEGERKQVTVTFCDMEGFTALSEGLGPEEAYAIMDQVYEILIHKVHDYEGTVNEMTGDGVVALFGAPIALEDAPQRAIRSSLAIHREMVKFSDRMKQERKGIAPLRMRIGIHTGPVVVGTLGNDLRVEFKAVGDTVNLASRMEELAEPGTTYVTEETFRLTEGLFRFEALGKKEVRGRKEPINVYRAIAPSTRRTRFDVSAERGLTPFVGRERELELLLDGLQRSKAGRGQAFSIMSEAGVGKSRLLYEFRKAVASEDVTFLEGRCLSYTRAVAYHPVIDILKANFDIHEGDGDFEIREKVKRGLKRLGADEASTLPYLLELLAVKDSGVDKIPMSPEVKKNRIMEAFKQIALKGSEIRPLILAYEDLHWIDKSSEELLKYVLDNMPGARVLLIFTYRPEFVHTWGAKSYHSQVMLNRLSNRESLMMVSNLLGTDKLDRDLEEFILEKTEGVPFFIEELIKSLKDLKIIEKEDNKYRITKDIKDVTIPATVQDVIMARVDSLPEGTKGLLQTVSVVGRESSYELIKQVTGLTEEQLLPQLSVLKDSELLYERGIYPQSTYVFKHALTQDVAYNSLLLKRRKEIHGKIGEVIESLYPDRLEEYHELLAYHYGRSADADRALQYLDLANQKAARLNAMEEAKAYFDEAMALLDALPETEENLQRRISLLVRQGEAFMLLLKIPEYYEFLTHYEPMARELGNPELLGAFFGRLGHCHHFLGHYDQAIQTLTKAVELCQGTGNAEDAGRAYAYLSWSHTDRGEYDQVLALKEDFLRTMEQSFNLRSYTFVLSAACRACSYLGRWGEAVEEGKKALSVAEEFSDNSLISFVAINLSIAYTWKGDLAQAVEYGELAFQKAPTPGDKAWAQRSLGWAWCRSGETARGIELLTTVLPIFRAGRYITSEIPLTCFLGEGYWLTGEDDKARQTLEKGLEMAERYVMRYYVGFTRRLLGEIALKTNPTQATPHFEKSITIFQEIKAENELAFAYASYGRFYKQQGDMAKARQYLTRSLEIFERLGTLIEPDKVREELAGLPEG
ncbi:MAG: tetratricopeptide repeat protein [Proteobacteria bacterium]|nr:tetratricopeptide repeat protein [Pseudomonadota bacterium]NIS71466.1 tetratricopeptide repeat protein [Pseudomonadota bacterium]